MRAEPNHAPAKRGATRCSGHVQLGRLPLAAPGDRERNTHAHSRRTNRRELISMANPEADCHERRRRRSPVRRSGGRVVSTLFFFPRGGSAQVARSLARALPAPGWQVTLAAGSLGQRGAPTHAGSFFAGLDVHALDYSPALELAEPLAAPVPFQPSYEDRPDAPDRIFAAVAEPAYERLVPAWIELLARAGAGSADMLHLHNLTPAYEAAACGITALAVMDLY